MSDSQSVPDLPDDCSFWPGDARTLFGLAPDASRRDLKRAYSKLIRRFKPEHAPEQFRRLREAFEELDQQFEWREQFSWRFEEAVPDAPLCAGTTLGDSGKKIDIATDSPYEMPLNSREMPTTTTINTDRIWQRGLDGGDLDSVYHELIGYHELTGSALSGRQTDIDFARLYWILTLSPECDSARDPCCWLIDGIRKLGTDNRLTALLSTEVHRRSGNVPVLLSCDLFDEDRSPNQLVALSPIRWQVARHHRNFELIAADIERLKRRFLDAPREWQQFLYAAIRSVVMSQVESAMTTLVILRAAFEKTPSAVEFSWLWDLYEETMLLHDSWENESNRLSSEEASFYRVCDIYNRVDTCTNNRKSETFVTFRLLLDLIGNTWEIPTAHTRSMVLTFCRRLTKNPVDSFVDLAVLTQRKRPLVIRLLELIREHLNAGDAADDVMTPAAEVVVQGFVQNDLRQLLYWQVAVTQFCLDQAVTPDDIATVILRLQHKLPHFCMDLAASIRNDLPINCIVEAQRALWQS